MLYLTEKGIHRLSQFKDEDIWNNLEAWILDRVGWNPGRLGKRYFSGTKYLGVGDEERILAGALIDVIIEEGLLVDR